METGSDANEASEAHSALQLCWREYKITDQAGFWCGQVIKGVHGLQVIRDELELLAGEQDCEKSLNRLAYHLENYLARVYELRERAVEFLLALSGQKKNKKKKKLFPINTSIVWDKVRVSEPALIDTAHQIVTAMSSDIELRNLQTHEMYLALRLLRRITISRLSMY